MPLEDFDDDFTTASPTATSGTLDLKNLPDGEYEFEVKGFAWKETKAGPLVTFKLGIINQCPHAGAIVQRDYWLTKKDENGGRVRNEQQLAQLRQDLKTLGFDVDNWTKENNRPFSREINRVPAVIQGVCFKGKKKANASGGQVYQNLYVNERLTTDGKPAEFGAADLEAANADPFAE